MFLFPLSLLHSTMDSLELFSFCLENFQLSFCYLFLVWFHCGQRHTLYGFTGVVFFLICWSQVLFCFFNLLSLALDTVFLWLLPWAFERMCFLQLSGAVLYWYQCCLVPVGQWCWVLLYPCLFQLPFGKGMLTCSTWTVASLFLPWVLSGFGICSSAVWCIHV